ncbi:F-box/kelch-repeat protein At5g43190-like [Selaginella moellendorffii]|uniref:F-box/kelch-repeat protein At5g43190-like n=1 Tax=Selaginella moellendorffii TaxID=88036 RepID=UPI000D1D02E5|nr:F-box/kelch-repeat protein At5g43190-like [Selaginella moellendorffii]|eukprot:XP_024528508.1 F-box/kelch-repeat protein At5g43190-like [Selaginella moellendorffii]
MVGKEIKKEECSHGIASDVTVLILSRLPLRDVARCSAVSRAWRELTAVPFIRRASASRETAWLVLHNRGQERPSGAKEHLAAYSAACRQWFSLGSVSGFLGKKCQSRWTGPCLAASAHGLLCCVFSASLTMPPMLAVFDPLTPASLRGTARRILSVDEGFSSIEALAMWKKSDGGYGIVLAGPISLWGSNWGVCLFDLADAKLSKARRSVASVDAITGRGFLSLLCSALRGDGSGLFCIWGVSSTPQILAQFDIQDNLWRIVHGFFPDSISWQNAAITASNQRRFTAQVHPNLLVFRERLLLLVLRESTAIFGLQIWELDPSSRGWIELRSMPEELGMEICRAIHKSSSAYDCWLHIRAVGSEDLVYLVMDWGWKSRVLVHELGSGAWRWLPTDGFSCRIDGCVFPFQPNPSF